MDSRARVSSARVAPIEGIAAQTVPDAILAARPTVRTDRLIDSAHEAYRRGIIDEEERDNLIKELEHHGNEVH